MLRTMVVLRTTDGAARRGRGGGGMAACLYEGAPAARRPARVARRSWRPRVARDTRAISGGRTAVRVSWRLRDT